MQSFRAPSVAEIEQKTPTSFGVVPNAHRRPEHNKSFGLFSPPSSSREDAKKNSELNWNFLHAPIVIDAFKDSEGLTEFIQEGDFLVQIRVNADSGTSRFARVLTLGQVNKVWQDSFDRDTVANSGKNALELSTAKPLAGNKRGRGHDLMGVLSTSNCHSIAQMLDVVSYLGPSLSPGTNNVTHANRLGAGVGLKSFVYQARGLATVGNLWGDVQVGDKVGFIVRKFQTSDFTSNDGITSARSKTGPLMFYPCVNMLGAETGNNVRRGMSTLVGSNNKEKGRRSNTEFVRGRTSAERSTSNNTLDPMKVGKSYIDYEIVETVDYGMKVSYIGMSVFKTGFHIHVGTVQERNSPAPKLSQINAAIVPGAAGGSSCEEAYRNLQIAHSIVLMIEARKSHCHE